MCCTISEKPSQLDDNRKAFKPQAKDFGLEEHDRALGVAEPDAKSLLRTGTTGDLTE